MKTNSSFFISYKNHINQLLDNILPALDLEPSLLHQAMRYAVLGGGKRLRAMLVYASGEACGVKRGVLDNAAAAVELVHAYSLIHDDLPVMDNDDLRHGRPSCHCVYGSAMAILTGDALQSLAFEVLATKQTDFVATQQLLMVTSLAKALGSCGMVGGQVLDIRAEGDVEVMHQKKTGALILASVQLGVLAAPIQDPLRHEGLTQFANKLGLAFQIQDDILDVESTTAVLGKTQGSDSAQNKASYPACFGLELAKQRAEELYEEALLCLDDIGLQSPDLRVLAEFMIRRSQ